MRFVVIAIFMGLSAMLVGCQTNSYIGEGPITLSPRVSALYSKYLQMNNPIAFVVSTDGKVGMYSYCPEQICQPFNEALKTRNCEKRSKGSPCKVYAYRKKIVWKGDVGNKDIQSVNVKMELLRKKPVNNPSSINGGAVIYMPGYNSEKPIPRTNMRVPPYLTWMEQVPTNWRIYKLFTDHQYRSTLMLDKQIASLRKLVVELKEKGYKRVILTGQSAGGWLAIKAAVDIPEVDGILAATPSKYGSKVSNKGAKNKKFSQSTDATVRLLRRIRDKQVILAFFEGDPWEPYKRAKVARQTLLEAGVSNIIIDHPKGIYGHHGAWSRAFKNMYSHCFDLFFREISINNEDCRDENFELAEFDPGKIDRTKLSSKEMSLSTDARKVFREIYWPKPVLEGGTYAYKFFAYSQGSGEWGWARYAKGEKPRTLAFDEALNRCREKSGNYGCKVYAIDNIVLGEGR